jgi:hypothetical protein
MGGAAGTGFLHGFSSTSLALEKYNREREREAQELAFKKQDLDLRRQILKGQEASRTLTDQTNQLQQVKLMHELRQQVLGDQEKQLLARLGRSEGGPLATPPTGAPAPLSAQGQPQDELPPLDTQIVPDLRPPVAGQPNVPAHLVAPQPRPARGDRSAMLYRPLFQQFGQQYGVDPVFLEAIASGGERSLPHEVSPKGATGVMQVLPATAAPYGGGDLTKPEVSIERAAQYIADLQKQFPGRPDLVAGAYFAGPGAIKQGQVPDVTDGITRAPQYVQNVMQRYQYLQGQQGAPTGQRVAGPGAPAPAPAATLPAPTADTSRLQRLDTERSTLEQSLQQLTALRPYFTTKDALGVLDKRIDDTRQELQLKETQIGNLQQRTLAATKEEREGYDKDFVGYFKARHNNQHPADALKAPEGETVLQQARTAYDTYKAEREANEAFLKEQQTQALKQKTAEASKALTPISDVTQQSISTNTSIFNSILKIEQILSEGGDLPENFVNLVSQNAQGIDAYLKGDPKALTGILAQYKTTYGAAASNDPRINRFLSALGNMRDLVIRERSGGNVTGNELARAVGAFTGSLPNINQAFALFSQNLANVKETVRTELVNRGASVLPLSGGDVVFEGLPDEIQAQILRQQQRAGARKRGEPPAAPAPAPKVPPPKVDLSKKPVEQLTPDEVQAELQRLEQKAGGP